MGIPANAEEMLSRARALPLREKLRLIEGLARQVADATPEPPAAAFPQSRDLLGLFSEEPDVMDEVMRHVREGRERSKTHPMRGSDE